MNSKNKIYKGILTYDFLESAKDQNVNNIGDYIQSIAAAKAINEDYNNLIYVEREALSSAPEFLGPQDKVKFIANGWYLHNQTSFPINEKYVPLFVSVHINDKFKLTKEVIENFKKYEPIGCRDIDSVKKLKKVGIKAYFTGCLTLTLEEDKQPRSGIIFIVDNILTKSKKRIESFEDFEQWPGSEIILNELKKEYSIEEIKKSKFLGQLNSLEIPVKEQFKIAQERLNELASADLVVTTRIHSLMPSMSLGTRTLFIMLNNKDDRFKGLSKYWNYIDFTKSITNNKKIKFSIRRKNNIIVNDSKFREDFIPLKKQVLNWWETF